MALEDLVGQTFTVNIKKPSTYTVGSFAGNEFRPIVSIDVHGNWDNKVFREADKLVGKKLKILIASPFTKPNPSKFQMEGNSWLE